MIFNNTTPHSRVSLHFFSHFELCWINCFVLKQNEDWHASALQKKTRPGSTFGFTFLHHITQEQCICQPPAKLKPLFYIINMCSLLFGIGARSKLGNHAISNKIKYTQLPVALFNDNTNWLKWLTVAGFCLSGFGAVHNWGYHFQRLQFHFRGLVSTVP